MAASGFGGGEAFRLSAAPGAGALKLHKGDISLGSAHGATDAIVSVACLLPLAVVPVLGRGAIRTCLAIGLVLLIPVLADSKSID